ncbi:MAG: hypothetical protein RPU62_07060 [Candidatus Sedimenticola sp. (ex Thyasira tokunagai)]
MIDIDLSELGITDPIEFLIERKFPDHRKLRIPPPVSGTRNGGLTRDYTQKRLHEIATYQKDLRSKTRDELLALYEIEKAKHRKEALEKAEQREQQRFFHQPHAAADFEHWSKATYWTLDEALALAFGKAPESVNWTRVEKHLDASPFAKRYARVRDLALRAKAFNQLYDPVLPGIFLAWARRIEIDIPPGLIEQVEKRGIIVADWKDLHDKLSEQYKLLNEKYEDLVNHQKQAPQEADNRDSILSQSGYWSRFEKHVEQAIHEFPAWRSAQRKIQKTGNLQEWLVKSIGVDNREAEVAKKILSDFFKELK